MLDPSGIRFRRLDLPDMDLLHKWLGQEHLMKTWGPSRLTYEQFVEKYSACIRGERPTEPWLMLYGLRPIGYIQTYRISDYPDYSQALGLEEDAAGVDLFIGDRAYLHRGLGAPALVRFVREVVFIIYPDLRQCVIGPGVGNKAAIRCYEKAGFTYLKTVRVPDEEEPEYLMRIDRDRLLAGKS